MESLAVVVVAVAEIEIEVVFDEVELVDFEAVRSRFYWRFFDTSPSQRDRCNHH
jgi:hypothetical protein